MHVTFNHPIAQGSFEVPDDLVEFFIWLSDKRENPRAHAMLTLLARHDAEPNENEILRIRAELGYLLTKLPLTAAIS